MEQKFQTSFIPKKQNAPVGGIMGGSIGGSQIQQRPKTHVSSLYMAIAVIIFIISIAAAGGAYFWKSYQSSANAQYKIDLADRQKQFDLNLITKLKAINTQIDSAQKLLNNHVAFSRIFDIIQKMTVSEIRFLSMDFKDSVENNGKLTISMKGQGKNLSAVAFQSDILSELSKYGISNVVKNPIISNPTLDSTGSVSFSFSAEIDKSAVSYSQSITGDNNENK
jgi:hypothetical protein